MKLWSEHLYNHHSELRSQAIEPVNDAGEIVVPGTLEKKPRAKILYLRNPKDILTVTAQALIDAEFPIEVCKKIDVEIKALKAMGKVEYLMVVKTCLDYVDAC